MKNYKYGDPDYQVIDPIEAMDDEIVNCPGFQIRDSFGRRMDDLILTENGTTKKASPVKKEIEIY